MTNATDIRWHRRGDKCPGSPSSWLRHYTRAVTKNGSTNVPCGTCNACCRNPDLEVDLTESEAKRLDHVIVNINGKPGPALPKHPDGSCVHLVGGKCSIYFGRPAACRKYDCRLYIFTNIWPDAPFYETVLEQWASPRLERNEDRVLSLALMLGVMEAKKRGVTKADIAALAAVDAVDRPILPGPGGKPVTPRQMASRLVAEFDALPQEVQDEFAAWQRDMANVQLAQLAAASAEHR